MKEMQTPLSQEGQPPTQEPKKTTGEDKARDAREGVKVKKGREVRFGG